MAEVKDIDAGSKKNPDIIKLIRPYFIIIFGSISCAIALNCFYDTHSLVVGGFTGLGMIFEKKFNIPIALTNIVLNVPLFLLSVRYIGWEFVGKTLFGVLSLSGAIALVPKIALAPADDILLAAVFGGIFDGIGIGLVLYAGGTTGGTDMLAVFIHRFLKSRSVVEIMQVANWIIILLGFSVFGISSGMYALIAIFAMTKMSDNIVEGFNFARQVYVISDKSEEIAASIMTDMSRGVTGINAKGMYSKQDKQMLYCVVPTKEIVRLKELVKSIDSKAFVIVSEVREVLGEGFIEDAT